jgi:hypothetical protein
MGTQGLQASPVFPAAGQLSSVKRWEVVSKAKFHSQDGYSRDFSCFSKSKSSPNSKMYVHCMITGSGRTDEKEVSILLVQVISI